jgi:hypothetical protein
MSMVVTTAGIAELYDRASGVPGWTARIAEDGIRVEMTPPPGYTIVSAACGAKRLVKLLPLKMITAVFNFGSGSLPAIPAAPAPLGPPLLPEEYPKTPRVE